MKGMKFKMINSQNLVHYVEFFYPYNPDVTNSMEDTDIRRIQERDPLLYTDNEQDFKIGFRFFDVNNGNSPLIRENRINISSIYYYGKYLSEEEITYIHKIMPNTRENIRMIQCYCGYLATDLNDGDITVEEYKNINTNKRIMHKMSCR